MQPAMELNSVVCVLLCLLSFFLFLQAWAVFKGKFKEGDKAEPATWKTRLRCALNKSPDFEEVTDRSQLDISEPYKVYRIVPEEEQKCNYLLGPRSLLGPSLTSRSAPKALCLHRARAGMPPTGFGCLFLANQSCSLLCKQTQRADLTHHVLSSGSFLQREWLSGGREGWWTLGHVSEPEAGRVPGAQYKPPEWV